MTDMDTIYKFLASKDNLDWVEDVEECLDMDAFVADVGDNVTTEHMENMFNKNRYTQFTIHHSEDVDVYDYPYDPHYILTSHLYNEKGNVVGSFCYTVSDYSDPDECNDALSHVMYGQGLDMIGDVAYLV